MDPRWLLAFALSLAAPVAAQPRADRDPGNHYILVCADGCPQKALEASIGSPGGIATDDVGNVYFSSQSIVFKLLRDGTLLRIAGTGMRGDAGDGGPAVAARLDIPFDAYADILSDPFDYVPLIGGLAVAQDGAVLIADAYNDRIRRVATDGTIATVVDASGSWLDLSWPQGVAIDRAGTIFVGGDFGGIRRMTAEGVVDDIAPWYCGGGPGSGACWPKQLAIDSAGAVHFPDGCHVRKWQAGQGLSTVAGRERPWYHPDAATCGYWGDGGPASDAGLGWMVFGIAIDADDRIYVADTFNHCIRRIDRDGVISTLAGECKLRPWPLGVRPLNPFEGDDGPAVRARLSSPMGVAVYRDGNVYIADTDHRRIRKVTPDGIITTVAGNGEALPPPMQAGSAATSP